MRGEKPTGVIIGDAAGIGPEITVKALSDPGLYRASRPVLIGDAEIVNRALESARIHMEVRPLATLDEARIQYPVLNVVDIPVPGLRDIPLGKLSPVSGEAFACWFRKAIQMAEAGELGAIVYAPLNKEAVHAAGYDFHDETDMIAAFSSTPPALLVVVSLAGRYRSATVPPLHASLRCACESLNRDIILQCLLLLHQGLQRLGIQQPVIGVSALNPHGGEGGLHGDEEVRIIGPAVEDARGKGVDARGPYPPDTVFVRARTGEFHCVLGMYHDQTRIAMKLLHFKKIIYTVLGTPIHFVSVAHGTAYDIAGRGIADAGNFKLALRYAAKVR